MKRQNLWKRMKKCYMLYLFLLPAVLMIAVFCYAQILADREKYADIEYLFSDSRFSDPCDPGIDD